MPAWGRARATSSHPEVPFKTHERRRGTVEGVPWTARVSDAGQTSSGVGACDRAVIPQESAATVTGLTAVHLELAKTAQKNGDFLAAKTHGTRVIKVDPKNEAGLAFMRENEKTPALARAKP